MNLDSVYQTIRRKNGRITKIKKEVIEVLFESSCLFSHADIVKLLNKKGIKPNRSTLYRELIFLTQNNIIIKHTFTDKDYYELPIDHHHHLICINCHTIQKVEIYNHLEKEEKSISKINNFKITNHKLEFFGLCKKCQ